MAHIYCPWSVELHRSDNAIKNCMSVCTYKNYFIFMKTKKEVWVKMWSAYSKIFLAMVCQDDWQGLFHLKAIDDSRVLLCIQ